MANEANIADHLQTIPPQMRFKPQWRGKPSVVYFIAGAGLIKIGTTTNIKSRFRSIKNSSPVEVELLGVIDGDQFNEMRLHGRFASLRRHGEWFEDEGQIREHIKALGSSVRNPTPTKRPSA